MMVQDPNMDAKAGWPVRESGCWPVVMALLAAVWVVGIITACQVVTWTLEQAYFGSSAPHTDPRWIITLAGGVALWLPFYLLSKSKQAWQRALFLSWKLAALLVILMVPARLLSITDSQGVAAIQIAALAVFLLGHRRARRHRARSQGWQGIGLAMVVGGLLIYPWAAWGALGSIMDILLGGLTAGLSGLAAAEILRDAFLTLTEVTQDGKNWLVVLGAPFTLAILAFGLGLNENEWLVLLALVPLGWLASAFWGNDHVKPGWHAMTLALALGISGPLMWIDPDELSIIVTAGPGELIQWATQAGFVAASIAIGCAIFAGWVYTRSSGSRLLQKGLVAAGGGVWVGLALVYFLAGQPGLFGERLFVILKDQLDVSGDASITDYAQRRSAVYQALVHEAEASQAPLRQALTRWGIRYQPYYLVNGLEVDGGPLVRLWLQTRPEVDRVLPSPHLRPLPAPLPVALGSQRAPASPQWNLTTIQANLVWDQLGVTGKGILVGQSDSGVDGQHPELSSQYRGKDGQNDASWYDPWYHTVAPVDIGGHGTHTLGSILGKSVGVAPDAEWIGCVNLARNLGNPALYLDCMQFMLAPFPQSGDAFHDGQPARGAQVLNNSWGCPVVEGCDPETFLPAVRALQAAGVFVVASAGNDGDSGCASIRDPLSLYQDVFSVGAIDKQGQRASFSSLGPVTVDGSNRTKPDLLAPGRSVLSAFPQDTYAVMSGTSMAGPHVVGVVALMWSANPKLVGNIAETRRILDASAQAYTGTLAGCSGDSVPNDTAGYGVVDALKAVQMALAEK